MKLAALGLSASAKFGDLTKSGSGSTGGAPSASDETFRGEIGRDGRGLPDLAFQTPRPAAGFGRRLDRGSDRAAGPVSAVEGVFRPLEGFGRPPNVFASHADARTRDDDAEPPSLTGPGWRPQDAAANRMRRS